MPKFVCKNCTFRFEADADKTGSVCPYCGERKLIKDESAEELVGEVEEDGRKKN